MRVVERRERTGHPCRKKRRFRRTIARPKELAASVKAGRELFYGTTANCVKCHGPTALGDGQQDDYDNWSKANNEFIKATNDKIAEIQSLKAELAEGSRATTLTQLKQQIRMPQKGTATSGTKLVATLLPPRNAIPRNLREGMLPRRAAADRCFLAHLGRHRGHADAGQRPGRAGRPGHADAARDLADCRLRSLVAVRAGQPAAEAADQYGSSRE